MLGVGGTRIWDLRQRRWVVVDSLGLCVGHCGMKCFVVGRGWREAVSAYVARENNKTLLSSQTNIQFDCAYVTLFHLPCNVLLKNSV